MDKGAEAESVSSEACPLRTFAALRVEAGDVARDLARLCSDPRAGMPALMAAVEHARLTLGRLHEAAFAARLSLTR